MFATKMDAEKPSDVTENKSTAVASVSRTRTSLDFRRGKCKWFNTSKGWGFIIPDDGSQEVFVHQSVLDMTGFRSLGENEIVDFKSKPTDKGVEATLVTGPDNKQLEGSKIHEKSKKRFRKSRCYNCGKFTNHLAAHCTETQTKRCHYCQSSEHLMANCLQSKNLGKQNESPM
ncbi:protein lin-28 homolog [Contarinia nasturtii]|uniref:protein lin-28 homolog n=1 Tax=Contarinia nasturtii TaxID=265458 RepID=UPI0012D39B91|nr:protein lin-28 homolog [Contarinia nasturtii]